MLKDIICFFLTCLTNGATPRSFLLFLTTISELSRAEAICLSLKPNFLAFFDKKDTNVGDLWFCV